MSQENVAVIQAIYDAFAAGDVPGIFDRMSPDIVWNEAENFPYADGNPYVGPEAIATGVLARCAGEWDGFTPAIDELLDAGDRVIGFGHYLGTYRQTGRAMRTQMVHVWTVAGGKAVRFQQYADTLQVAKVIA
jgi:ketosteroid isomerase-like protein